MQGGIPICSAQPQRPATELPPEVHSSSLEHAQFLGPSGGAGGLGEGGGGLGGLGGFRGVLLGEKHEESAMPAPP